MNINWKVRFANKQFWLQIIPAVILLIQAVANVFGFVIDLSEMGNKLIEVVNAVFGILVIVGIVNDPTTKGVSDSERAMEYEEPN